MRYIFGMPRQATSPAYRISGKLINGGSLRQVTTEDGQRIGLESPIKFSESREMHPEHGGNYTVAVDLNR